MSTVAMPESTCAARSNHSHPTLDVSILRHRVAATREGRLTTTLAEFARAAAVDVPTARELIARLDRLEYVVTVDIDQVDADMPFDIEWAPVTGIVDLMLDWDILDLDISIDELSTWLEVDPAVTHRALLALQSMTGTAVSVRDPWQTVHVALEVEQCPLTTSAHRSTHRWVSS